MKDPRIMLLAAAALAAFGLQGCTTMHAGQGAAAPHASAHAIGADSTAMPGPAQAKVVLRADNQQNFEAVAAAIHKQMEPGGRWQYVDAEQRATINGHFADMRKLFERFGSVDKMDAAATTRLLGDQHSINTILTSNDGDRLICERHAQVGSHFPVKTCKTYAQIRAEQDHAQDFMRRRNAKGTTAVQGQSLNTGSAGSGH